MSKFKVKIKLERNKDLFPYLTIRSHIKAEFFFEAKSQDDLINAVLTSKNLNLPLFFLAGGSNLAPQKDKISGLVVHNLYVKKEILREEKDFVEFLVSSGYQVSRLVAETVEAGLAGFEYHKGLPGTVGGAIYMNSKWTKPMNYFGQNLLYAYLLGRDGNIKKVDKKYFQFAYDYSILQKTKEILLEAVFQLTKTDKKILKARSDAALEYRKKTQPYGVASSGCFFKNAGPTSAGYLIDKAGLKGYAVGGFVVSDKHANFILNKGNGKPKDLVKLVFHIKNRVKEKFGVELEEEVILV